MKAIGRKRRDLMKIEDKKEGDVCRSGENG
jgi:hypothetical protein